MQIRLALLDLVWLTYIYICIYLSIYLPIYLSTYLPIYLSTYLPIYLSTYVPIYLSTYLSIYLPIYLSTYLPIYLSTYLPIYLYLSIYLSIHMYLYVSICIYIYICCIYIYAMLYIYIYINSAQAWGNSCAFIAFTSFTHIYPRISTYKTQHMRVHDNCHFVIFETGIVSISLHRSSGKVWQGSCVLISAFFNSFINSYRVPGRTSVAHWDQRFINGSSTVHQGFTRLEMADDDYLI